MRTKNLMGTVDKNENVNEEMTLRMRTKIRMKKIMRAVG